MKTIKNSFFIFIFGLFLLLILLPFYREGKIISGGEGSYYLDFPLVQKNLGYSWIDYGTGIYSVATNFGHVFHLVFLQNLIPDERVINFIMIYLIYFLPFAAVYLLGLEVKLKPVVSFLLALFYVFNPFMSNFLKSINQWNMLAAYILPAFFWLILKFYNKNFKLFLFFGFHSLFFAFTSANPPTMVLYQIAIVFFLLVVSVYKEKSFCFKLIIKNYLILFSSFVCFNFWWLINWFYILSDVQEGYTKESALSWLRGSGKFIPRLWRTFNLTSLLEYPLNPFYDFFNKHFSSLSAAVILTIPFLIIIYFLFKRSLVRLHHLVIGIIMIFFAFLAKGINGYFGGIYSFMVMNLSIFRVFRSASEKWGLLFTFFLTLFLVFILKRLKSDQFYKLILVVFSLYIIFASYPFATGNFIPDYRHDEQVTGSRMFFDKAEYKSLRESLNNDPELYRALSLPGSANYQIALQIKGKKFYTGNDPVLNNTNKPFLAPYNGSFSQRFYSLFDSILEPNFFDLLGFFNIKKIIINKDMYPWFGFREKANILEIEEALDKKLVSLKNEVIDLYDVGDFYLPRFYVADKLIYTSANGESSFLTATSLNDFSKRTAIYPEREKAFDRPIGESEFIKNNSSKIILTGQVQSTVDEARLRTGTMGFDPMGVLFPYARWKPGGFIYQFVRKKEQKTKKQFSEPKDLFEIHLFFAAKRIYEIQKWGDHLGEEKYTEVLGQYREEMLAAIDNLDKLAVENVYTYPLLVEFEVSFGAHEERLTGVLEGIYASEENKGENSRIIKAKAVIQEIEQRLGDLIQKHYSQTNYFFEIGQEGEYEILVKREGVPPNPKIQATVPGEESEILTPVSEEQNQKNYISFGQKSLTQGTYLLEFVESFSENLPTGDWKGEDKNLGQEIKLFGKRETVYQNIQNWQPKKLYEVSFEYKVTNGMMRVFLSEEREDMIDDRWVEKGVMKSLPPIPNLLEKEVNSNEKWEEFKVLVSSSKNSRSARLYISNMTEYGVSDVECRDVNVRVVYEPEVILRKSGKNNYDNIPQITFEKINPTKYIVDIQNATNPYFLVFSESFHRGWKAYVLEETPSSRQPNQEIVSNYFDGEIRERRHQNTFFDKSSLETWGKKYLPDEKHIIMNDYANSWYLTPADVAGRKNYRLIIEYWPQKLFYFGIGVTVLTVFICSIAVVARLIKAFKLKIK